MFCSLKKLIGFRIAATDGLIGKVNDFYFQDNNWFTRYLVINLDCGIYCKKVLIFVSMLNQTDLNHNTFSINMSKKEIRFSPPISSNKPLSREKEIELFKFFKWDPYWCYHDPDMYSHPISENRSSTSSTDNSVYESLHRFNEIQGFYIQAKDGDVGHVDDLLVNIHNWKIRYLVLNTQNWLPDGKTTILPSDWVTKIGWTNKKVYVYVSHLDVKNGPDYDPTRSIDRKYEKQLYDYYGRPVYWEYSHT